MLSVHIISSHQIIRETLQSQLSQAFSVMSYDRIHTTGDITPAAFIIDITSLTADLVAAISSLKKQHPNAHLVGLLPKVTQHDQLLMSVLDSHHSKPYDLSLILSRLEILNKEALPNNVIIGDFAFRPSRRTLTKLKTQTEVALTEKESAILSLLHKEQLEGVSREQLLEKVWGFQPDITTHTLETHIYRLRQKLEVDPIKPQHLITQKDGYCLKCS